MWLEVCYVLALIFPTSTVPVNTENLTKSILVYEDDVELKTTQAMLVDEIVKVQESTTTAADKIRRWPMNLDGFVVVPVEFDAKSGYCK